MKGTTLWERSMGYELERVSVVYARARLEWAVDCPCAAERFYVDCFPTHAEALAAANAHALEHLGEDTATWAADEFAVGSEVWQEDQR